MLLSAAFVYDIFWVFISPLIFEESVMIVVSAISFLLYFGFLYFAIVYIWLPLNTSILVILVYHFN